VDIQLARFARLLQAREIALELTDKAKGELAELGYDPAYGARPLKRAIQEEILEPLSSKIIAGEIKPGQRVHVDFSRHEFHLTTK
jgi:ATP-dependent Clp protease ATP-binding subunit ClpB